MTRKARAALPVADVGGNDLQHILGLGRQGVGSSGPDFSAGLMRVPMEPVYDNSDLMRTFETAKGKTITALRTKHYLKPPGDQDAAASNYTVA